MVKKSLIITIFLNVTIIAIEPEQPPTIQVNFSTNNSMKDTNQSAKADQEQKTEQKSNKKRNKEKYRAINQWIMFAVYMLLRPPWPLPIPMP